MASQTHFGEVWKAGDVHVKQLLNQAQLLLLPQQPLHLGLQRPQHVHARCKLHAGQARA
jgi:hypothetical protein